MAEIMLSAFADEYAPATRDQIFGLGSLGIKYIEVRQLDGKNISNMSQSEVKTVKRQFDDAGIKVSAIGSPLGKVRLDGDLREHMEKAKRVFETANTLDTHYVRIFSFYAPEGKNIVDMKDQVVDTLGEMLRIAKQHGVVLCHENEAKIYGDTPARCRELLDIFGGELRCVFDMGNFVLEGVDPYPEAYELLREFIAYFHIKDALSAGAVVPPGMGEAKIKQILDAHREYAKDDFFVSLEPHLQTFSGLNFLVGRDFDNPYKYPDAKTAFRDAVQKFGALVF